MATSIRLKKDDAFIIFITSYVNYISDTFRLGAFQFLIKPFSEEDFKIDFERAINTYISKHINNKEEIIVKNELAGNDFFYSLFVYISIIRFMRKDIV